MSHEGKYLFDVIIETPKGSRNKYVFDPDKNIFKLKKVLSEGFSFPFDFGFIPGTIGGDGDPLDVLCLMDQPAYPGIMVEARIIGIIKAIEIKKGKKQRNDRLIAVENNSVQYEQFKNLSDLPETLVEEIRKFLVYYKKVEGQEYEVKDIKDAKSAKKIIEKRTGKGK